MPAQATMLSPQQLIDAAKAPEIAFGNKDWNAVKAAITPDFVYDEIATGRKTNGADEALSLWKGWAAAFPDSKPTFHNAVASGTTVVLEATWSGTHKGPLLTPNGTVAPTGKRIDVRACIVNEMAGERVRVQRHYFDMATLLRQLGAGA
ncbi:MAG TPA: ester cyclase [Gemmatimonadales bacterium]|nr:ester cyclase [Gemmatimonadales bacterium]